MRFVQGGMLFSLTIGALLFTTGCATNCRADALINSCNLQPKSQSKNQPDSQGWILQFEDLGEVPWQDNWFLDGRSAQVTNTQKGIRMIAGPEPKNDAHHAVLWTKQQFSGDVKIEYDFTKIDDMQTMVNILFIQATGIGGEFAQDITLWSHRRQVPSMKFYFERMKLLHISYAAYGQVNDDPNYDYIRARAYPLHPTKGFKGMEITPSYFRTGLFKKDITYAMVIEKTKTKMTLSVKAKNASDSSLQTFTWQLPERGQVDYGRIGLRQMYTRSSIYNNFRIYSR
jgi:hypothetical protein